MMTTETNPQTLTENAAPDKGENIPVEVEADYTWVLELQRDPLKLVDRASQSPIDTSKPYKGMHFCWVCNGKDGRRDQIGEYEMMGYEVCRDDDVAAPAQIKGNRKVGGAIVVKELTLMWCKWGIFKAITDEALRLDKARMHAIFSNLKGSLPEGSNAYGTVEIEKG
jgi:hypothetical protein